MNKLANITASAAALSIFSGSFLSHQYADLPGFVEDVRNGRTKNAVANIVSGLAAQNLCRDKNSSIEMNVGKKIFPDSQINGNTTSTSINTHSDLLFTSSSFNADGNVGNNNLKGEVLKSEFNWDVKQKSPTEYKIERFAVKFNRILDLELNNGNIAGSYKKPLSFNWNIDGAYIQKSSGNYDVQMDVEVPFGLDLDIQGNVVCK